MKLLFLAAKNVLRNKFRTSLTVLGVAVAILAFMLLRTVLTAWTAGADYAAKDRIATRHKVTFVMQMPKRYIDEIRSVRGVKAASWANWFGAKDPNHEHEFFATLAVDTATLFEVFDELQVPADQKEKFLHDKQGALVGDVLMRKLGWKLGQTVTLKGSIYPGDWQFTIDGVYTAARKSVDRSTFFFHWDYLNDSLPPRSRDQIGWVASRIDDPRRSADISREIDKRFEDRDVQTVTMSERAMQLSFLGMISAVLTAINIVSIVILAIMMLILGNTIAMGVRERTNEYGVMRAIGFLPKHIAVFVLGEAATIGLIGGLLGLALSYPIVQLGLGRWLEENMGGFFPYFRISATDALLALILAAVLGLVAAAVPAARAARLNVVDALRRVG